MIFGGTEAAEGGFVERSGILTDLELPQYHPGNRNQLNKENQEIEVTFYSDGRFYVSYHIKFDQWTPMRGVNSFFDGEFEINVGLEFTTNNGLKQSYTRFAYKGDVSQSHEADAEKLRTDKRKEDVISSIERLGLAIKAVTQRGKNAKGKLTNIYNLLNNYNNVSFDGNDPLSWRNDASVQGIGKIFSDYISTLEEMEKLDFKNYPGYERFKKKRGKIEKYLTELFESYLKCENCSFDSVKEEKRYTEINNPEKEKLISRRVDLIVFGDGVRNFKIDINNSDIETLKNTVRSLEQNITDVINKQYPDDNSELDSDKAENNLPKGDHEYILNIFEQHNDILQNGIVLQARLNIAGVQEEIRKREEAAGSPDTVTDRRRRRPDTLSVDKDSLGMKSAHSLGDLRLKISIDSKHNHKHTSSWDGSNGSNERPKSFFGKMRKALSAWAVNSGSLSLSPGSSPVEPIQQDRSYKKRMVRTPDGRGSNYGDLSQRTDMSRTKSRSCGNLQMQGVNPFFAALESDLTDSPVPSITIHDPAHEKISSLQGKLRELEPAQIAQQVRRMSGNTGQMINMLAKKLSHNSRDQTEQSFSGYNDAPDFVEKIITDYLKDSGGDYKRLASTLIMLFGDEAIITNRINEL